MQLIEIILRFKNGRKCDLTATTDLRYNEKDGVQLNKKSNLLLMITQKTKLTKNFQNLKNSYLMNSIPIIAKASL